MGPINKIYRYLFNGCWNKYSGMRIQRQIRKYLMVNQGNMTTKLLRKLNFQKNYYINPWADEVKLARTGGELNSIAIKNELFATNKTKIAISNIMGGMIGILQRI